MPFGVRTAAVALLALACAGPRPAPSDQTRVISLVPSVTEIIYALGAGEMLVGNTTTCDWPGEARAVRKVGSFYQPDIEHIAALKPDLVFLALPTQRPVAEKLEELGIPAHVSDPHDFPMLFAEIESIGRLLGRATAAESLRRAMTERLKTLPARPDTPRVYVEISAHPLMSAGRGTFLNEIIGRAGGRNICADIDRPWPVVNPEDVIIADPEVIILLHPGTSPAELRSRLGWAGITAVRKRRVFADLDQDLLVRPGPRAVAGIEQLRARLDAGRTGP